MISTKNTKFTLLMFDVACNSKKKNTVFSLPDIIHSCSEVTTFISKHSPHLEINRIKKKM